MKNRLIDGYLRETSAMHELYDNYIQLFTKLHEIPFVCRRDLDQNRVQDARDYREKIARKYDVKYNTFYPISVLELLLSLSERFASTLFAPNDPDFNGQEELFSLFLENLGLFTYLDDDNFDGNKVERICKRWMDLEYNNDGTNGNIVAKPGNRKLKSMDIWMQLNVAIYPNFDRVDADSFPVNHPYTN